MTGHRLKGARFATEVIPADDIELLGPTLVLQVVYDLEVKILWDINRLGYKPGNMRLRISTDEDWILFTMEIEAWDEIKPTKVSVYALCNAYGSNPFRS